jgi:hypothetical protein
VLPDERDGQRFWLSVLDALRGTTAGSTLVRAVSAAPDLDCWAVVEGLLEDLDNLREPAWLVIDDLHELESSEALRQLELLVLRPPVVNRSAPLSNPRVWLVHAFLLEAIAHDALGDTGAAARSLEQALQLAESDGLVLAFLRLQVR